MRYRQIIEHIKPVWMVKNLSQLKEQQSKILSVYFEFSPSVKFSKYRSVKYFVIFRNLPTMTDQSSLLLRKQLAELNKNPVEGFSAGLVSDDDIYQWEVVLIGPQDTLFEGGFFKAYLTFPYDYPLRPPKMKFITEIWHPNVAKNGDVCISILHEPGEDRFGYERPEERWLPVHTVETIMISVISMLADPNVDSPLMWTLPGSGEKTPKESLRGRWLGVYGKARRWPSTNPALSQTNVPMKSR
ncbi:hypothetical protein AGOR_G00250630 [Albula goreensis]|uniref:Ubiquitin-conjugating enzyme E2 G1 n=1 Tax=Albula goreensis TaxID=1534307 RepID=A0A8T3CEG9_9TELE|nr:hypothetical protein AGOR_G00250630 [Albula goreensis]